MTMHARFGGSSAHRWLKCPASTFDFIGVEEKENEAAAAGTEAHELAASRLLGQPPVECSPEMDWAISVYTNEVVRVANGFEVLIEEQLTHPTNDQIGGIADAIVWDPDGRNLTVLDFKFGFKRVEVEENAQLLLYAWLFSLTRNVCPVTITLTIVQPRCSNVASWSTDSLGLMEFGQRVEAAIKATENPVEVVGDHCLYCRRAPFCASLKASNQIVIGEAEQVAKGIAIAPERLAEMLKEIPRAQAMLKALWSYAETLLARGVQIPGYTLDADNFGRRKWIDWDLTRKFLQEHGFTDEQLYKREPVSPAQAELALPPEAKKLMRSFTTADRLPPKMVQEKEAKAPVAGIKASDVFKRVK